jgi:putative DNA primase/helicase
MTAARLAQQEAPNMPEEKADIQVLAEALKNAPPMVDPKDFMAMADMFVERNYTSPDGRPKLKRFAGITYAYDGANWRPKSQEEKEAEIWCFLRSTVCQGQEGPKRVKPTPAMVISVAKAVDAVTAIPDGTKSPCWLGEPVEGEECPPADELVVVRNGLLHPKTHRLVPHTPAYFSTTPALPVAYDPKARCDGWDGFLRQILEGDPQAINALKLYFGYLLTNETRQQKALAIIGPRRSGKGTILKVLTAIFGAGVVCPTLASLGTPFGKAPLIDKLLAVFSDARVSNGDALSAISEAILSIIGEDDQCINRKYLPPWIGHLTVRLILMANELPRFTDHSGALANRFIIIQLRKSFLGEEDLNLADRLAAEAPGILNWMLDGLAELRRVGRLVQPESGKALLQEFEELTSPVSQFIAERCIVAPSQSVKVADLFNAWGLWAETNGWPRAGSVGIFSRDLHAAIPTVELVRPRASDGSRDRRYSGVGLRPSKEFPANSELQVLPGGRQ